VPPRKTFLLIAPSETGGLDIRPFLFRGVQRFMEWPAPPSGVGSPTVQTEEWIMKIAALGVDLGKNVCSLVGLDDVGVVIVRSEPEEPR
jgi:hypothetical protein